MAFSSEIKGKMQGLPSMQGYPEAFRTEWVWGEWDGAAVTTGDIDLECDNVLFCQAIDSSATPGAIQIELDTDGSGAQPGWVSLTFSSGHAGRFLALVSHRR